MCDISEDADVPVILCADECSIGKSVTCSFTFNPSTGVVCATCFHGTVSCATNACKGWDGSAFANFGSNAFNSTSFTTCTGTVTGITVCCNGTSLGTANATTPSKTFNICDRQVQHIQVCCSADRNILFASSDITCDACCCVYYSDGTNGRPFTYNSNTGELKVPKVTIGDGCATKSAGIICAHGNKSTNAMIQFVNNTNDANGNGYVIGGGGIGIIGAGESATTVWVGINGNVGLYGTCAGNECLYITADQDIYFYSNVNGGYACRKTATFCASTGYLHSNICGNVCGQSACALYINRTAITTGECPLAFAGNCNTCVAGGICVSGACQVKFDVATGNLKTTKLSVGDGCATMQYNSTTQAIEFVFA